ncbi:hypothetical protein KKF91_04170 [Myxococcota bacterium]|nr:hypothetical protein [Myxococcota bacterium]MBU1429741.1 hypothetical protein [Myxococcota bacterium]MBU1897959.1 hypothetical protein [Myxococcota bacterium]
MSETLMAPLGLFLALAAVPAVCGGRLLLRRPDEAGEGWALPPGWSVATGISFAALLGGVFFAVLFLNPPLRLAIAHLEHLPSGGRLSEPATWLNAVGHLLAICGAVAWQISLLLGPTLMAWGVLMERRAPLRALFWLINALLWPLVGALIISSLKISRVGGHQLALTTLLAMTPLAIYTLTAAVARRLAPAPVVGAPLRERPQVEIIKRAPRPPAAPALPQDRASPAAPACPPRSCKARG